MNNRLVLILRVVVLVVVFLTVFVCERVKSGDSEQEDEIQKDSMFLGFILLEEGVWSMDRLEKDFLADWGMRIPEQTGSEDVFVFYVDEMMVALSFTKMPLPNGEAEQSASRNHVWKESVEVTKTHKAHIVVTVLSDEKTVFEMGKLYVKICSSLLKQEDSLGIYTSGTVFEPSFYIEFAEKMKADGDYLPVSNWINVGVYQSEKGIGVYTSGMAVFGKDEMEIVGSRQDSETLYFFLLDIADYVIRNDVTLRSGETIGTSAQQKLEIIRSEGVAVSGKTLKIAF